VKVALGDVVADVAVPRRERSTGAGHRDFVVEAGPEVSLEDDLGRRDFRMNMLARAIRSGELIDPYGGVADIRASRIDIMSEAAFAEDPLRMLRAAQFSARFRFQLTERSFAAMQAAAPLVGTVSAERCRDELIKLLAAETPSSGFELLRHSGVLAHILPELLEGVDVAQNEYHAYDVYQHGLATLDATPVGDLELRLAGLLHDVGKPRVKDGPHFYGHEYVGEEMATAALQRLRFANGQTETVARLVRNHMYAAGPELSDAAVRKFIRRVGPENLNRQFSLRHADIRGSGLPKRSDENGRFEARVRALMASAPPLSVRHLAISGEDVIGLAVRAGALPAGSRGGPIVGHILSALLERVMVEPELNQPATLLSLAESLLRPPVPRGTNTVKQGMSAE
ncbi:MAG: HD domain-containing protein, partial [Candidatus Eremiobacteraeota bacterium]|nr:HD domain-containing protein [Candidatus Eremiobacteraeota bacterium]